MARIRSIKPEFFRHEGLQDLEADNPGLHVMLVFAGLWCHCDSKGRFEWRPRQLKLDILPFLEFSMADSLAALVGAGLVVRYSVAGKEYAEIPSFVKHQRITGKEATDGEKYPGSDGESSGKQQGNGSAQPVAQEREREREMERSLPIPSGIGGEISVEISPMPPVDNSILSETQTGKPTNGKHRLPCPYQRILALYDQHLPMCPRVIEWTETRKKHLSALWHRKASELGWKDIEEGVEYFYSYFEFVARSPFLTGRVDGRNGKPPFVANLEWLITPSRFANVVEGKYHA